MTVWRQSGTVWLGAVAAAGLALLTQILLARNLDDETFGALSNAYAIAILVATFAFQGLGEVALRNLAVVDLGRCVVESGDGKRNVEIEALDSAEPGSSHTALTVRIDDQS